MNVDKTAIEQRAKFSLRGALTVLICIHLWLITSCTSKPTDLRTLVPAETLIYLETNDLGAAIQPIIDSKPFGEIAKSKPDLSAVKGVQLAIAVTGFDMAEEKLNDEQSVGNVRPHFVAVADTHAWNWQAVSFAEKKLGSFVAGIYDSEPTLVKSDKFGGNYFNWTAKDGRKAFALVLDGIIYFANDETSIDKCLAVKRGESDSISKTGKLPPADPKAIASGYVGSDGVAQIANIAGLKLASEAGDESEVRSAFAGLIPEFLRKNVTQLSWTAAKTDRGIEDRYLIWMPADVANVFSETMSPAQVDKQLLNHLPSDAPTVSLYNFADPQVAWRSLVLTAQSQTDALAARMIGEFGGILFEPYGIHDPEMFLSGVGSSIITTNFDSSGDKPAIIAKAKNVQLIKTSMVPSLKPPPENSAADAVPFWRSEDDDVSALFFTDLIFIGSDEAVQKCYADAAPGHQPNADLLARFTNATAPITTIGRDQETAGQIVDLISDRKTENLQAASTYFTETRFNKNGMDRRTVSDLGLIGSIIAQLGSDQ